MSRKQLLAIAALIIFGGSFVAQQTLWLMLFFSN